MREELDFSNLIPEFRLFLEGDIPLSSAQGFSTCIVFILLALMAVCLIFAIWQCVKAHSQVKFYRKILRAYQSDQLFAKREEINEKMQSRANCSGLWQEFDESLVCMEGNLYNTLDASHFFNHYSLARGLTDNRFLAAVPGFLTAIGVIGTFAGLQIGLGEIQDAGFGSVDSGVDEIKAGIGGMIAGAAIAFMTSVWGIGSSVFFNLCEKTLERSIRSAISKLQNQIDSLYQRLTAEKSLADIEGHSRESRQIMQTLAEQIGERMQQALIETTDKIKDSLVESLESILGPNIEKLVENANLGSEAALNKLVERFMGAMSSEGRRQSEQMNVASAGVQNALDNMQLGLNDFMKRLDQQMGSIAERNRSIMEGVQRNLTEQIDSQQQQANQRDQSFHEQVRGLQDSQQLLGDNLNQMIATQNTQQQRMLDQILGVTGAVESMANHNQVIGEQLGETANAYLQQVNALRELSQAMQAASAVLAKDIHNATQTAQALMQQNERIGERSEKMLAEIRKLSESLLATTSTLDKTATKSTEGLQQVEQHFNALTERLSTHSEDFSRQVEKLLSDYHDQVNSQTQIRLNQWNEQTQAYITTMTNAVQALSEVVDEIEDRTIE